MSLYVLINFRCELMSFEKILKIFVCKINLKKFQKFKKIKFYQS